MPPAALTSHRTPRIRRAMLTGLTPLLAALLTGCDAPSPAADDAYPQPAPSHTPAAFASYPNVALAGYPQPTRTTRPRILKGGTIYPTAAPTASPTPKPTRPPELRGRLMVDRESERVIAHIRADGADELVAFDSASGERVQSAPLLPDEDLIDIDTMRRRVYVGDAQHRVRWLDPATFSEGGTVALPTPEPRSDAEWMTRQTPPILPALDATNGALVTSSARAIHWFDADDGRMLRELPVTIGDLSGPFTHLAVSRSGERLYLAASDLALATQEGRPGTRLAAIDLTTGTLIEAHGLRSNLFRWLPLADGILATTAVYKDVGVRHSLWQEGRERMRQTESNVRWIAFDAERERLVGILGEVWGDPSASFFAFADVRSLNLDQLAPSAHAAAVSSLALVGEEAYAWTGSTERLMRVPAATFDAPMASAQSIIEGSNPLHVRRLPPTKPNDPPLLVGSVEMGTSATATVPGQARSTYPTIISSDLGATWQGVALRSGGYVRWPDCLTRATGPSEQIVLFGCRGGAGVVRSDDGGRSWHPASAGIRSLAVRELAVSPTFDRDGLVLATTYTGIQSAELGPSEPRIGFTDIFEPDGDGEVATLWRSQDGGDAWQPVGRYAAVAFAPNYADDRVVMAFEYLSPNFAVSQDGGLSWNGRGRLAELEYERFVGTRLWVIPDANGAAEVLLALGNSHTQHGGGPHWPESGARIFRSTDGGWTWDLAWERDESPSHVWSLDGDLMGPIEYIEVDRAATSTRIAPSTWILRLDSATLISHNGGINWFEHELPDDPLAYPVDALPNGHVLIAGGDSGALRSVPLAAFQIKQAPASP